MAGVVKHTDYKSARAGVFSVGFGTKAIGNTLQSSKYQNILDDYGNETKGVYQFQNTDLNGHSVTIYYSATDGRELGRFDSCNCE